MRQLGPLLLLGLILVGCGSEPTELVHDSTEMPSYVDPEAEFPRVSYPGIGVTVNDRCPVRQVKLNRKMKPVYANGQPVGFC